ncbi:MAG: hypothetical protein IPH13_17800 [Planctomycetes bacterium]|nr:hypothetical protein [Planctomycetota bacterium]MCC7169947.1 hypothetical protein [Planctomycetota bacterium]
MNVSPSLTDDSSSDAAQDAKVEAVPAIELPALRLRPRELDTLRRAGAAAWPEPMAGLLLGRATMAVVCVERVIVLRQDPTRAASRALIRATDWMAEGLVAKAQGLELVGAWVARPRGEARHEVLDASIVRDGLSMLVIATRDSAADTVEALRWERGILCEQTLEVVVPARVVAA